VVRVLTLYYVVLLVGGSSDSNGTIVQSAESGVLVLVLLVVVLLASTGRVLVLVQYIYDGLLTLLLVPVIVPVIPRIELDASSSGTGTEFSFFSNHFWCTGTTV
jgi:hypothetical protein